MFGLVAYGSSGDDDEGAAAGGAGHDVDDSDDGSSDSSLDSAAIRAAEAKARLRDFGHEDSDPPPGLPSAFDVFDEVNGPPAFLDPEATRQLAAPVAHGSGAGAAAAALGPGGKTERMLPGPGFDISLLAPKAKGEKRQTNDPRELPEGSVIQSKAKRYKTEDGPEATQQYTAMQIAMLGGNVEDSRQPGSAAVPAGPRVPTAPMEVSEFLNKGIGAAQLPRKAQDRRDKEKNKRAKGQSAIGSWKTEAEMVLRQQFDS